MNFKTRYNLAYQYINRVHTLTPHTDPADGKSKYQEGHTGFPGKNKTYTYYRLLNC